jgi:hypothetical protein
MAQVYVQCSSTQGLFQDRRTTRAAALSIRLSHRWLRLSGEIRRNWHAILQGIRDPYRPELHYMRGPGPKWRAKHGIPEMAAASRRSAVDAASATGSAGQGRARAQVISAVG